MNQLKEGATGTGRFCVVENDTVVFGPTTLTRINGRAGAVVSIGSGVPWAEMIASHGVYPHGEVKPDYDAETEQLSGPDRTVEEDGVYDTWTVEPIPEPDPADISLTRRQIRTVLVAAGKSATHVSDLIDAMPEGSEKEQAIVDWDDATRFAWDHFLIVALRADLAAELTEAEIAAIWVGGADLPA